MGACKPLRIWLLMCHNRKMGTFWPYHCFLIQITLCFHHSVIATKVLINSDSGCKKCGVKVINFTVWRLHKEPPVSIPLAKNHHNYRWRASTWKINNKQAFWDWTLRALLKSQNWPTGVVFSKIEKWLFLRALTKKLTNSMHIILELTDLAG